MTIRGGSPSAVGGGILNDGGTLALDRVELYDNGAISDGGLYNNGTAYLVDSDVTFNVADLIGGGVFHEGGTLLLNGTLIRGNSAANGGGIYNDGAPVTIEDGSEVQSNTSTGNGAGVLNAGTGALQVTDSSSTENISQSGDGGGILSEADATISLTDTDMVGNQALSGGGIMVEPTSEDLMIEGGRFAGNTATVDGGGLVASQLIVSGATFEGNSAGDRGGAIHGRVGCTVTDSRLESNSAEDGGGAHFQSMLMHRSRVVANDATRHGGGMYVWNFARVEDSHLSFNVAASDGGALWVASVGSMERNLVRDNVAQGEGGGVWAGAENSTLQISNTTISGNSTPLGSGSGLFIEIGVTVQATNITLADNFPGESLAKYGDLTLQNSIITSPDGIDCVVLMENPEIDSIGNNLSDDDTCVGLDFATDQTEVDVPLAPLAYTSSDTMTHALLDGSPAIDNGDNVACDAEPVAGVDQRNGARDVGLNCDIGAHEQGAAVSLTLFADGFE